MKKSALPLHRLSKERKVEAEPLCRWLTRKRCVRLGNIRNEGALHYPSKENEKKNFINLIKRKEKQWQQSNKEPSAASQEK